MNSLPDRRRKLALFAALAVLLIVAALYIYTSERSAAGEDPLAVVQSYLKASYARDYKEAYGYISSMDQSVRDESSYAQHQRSFNGFAFQLAKKLAEEMEIWVIEHKISSDRAHRVGYRVPIADELSSLLLDWDPDKLNSLSRAQQEQLLEAVEKLKNDERLIMIAGQETFDLVPDKGRWKIFFDWASGIKVSFRASPSAEIDAQLPQREILTKGGEPFQVALEIKNRSDREVLVTIGHLVEPRDVADHLYLIACGFLLPVRLLPGSEEKFASAYLLGDGVREDVRQLAITYEFKLEK